MAQLTTAAALRLAPHCAAAGAACPCHRKVHRVIAKGVPRAVTAEKFQYFDELAEKARRRRPGRRSGIVRARSKPERHRNRAGFRRLATLTPVRSGA
jgi:hypothetical protein